METPVFIYRPDPDGLVVFGLGGLPASANVY